MTFNSFSRSKHTLVNTIALLANVVEIQTHARDVVLGLANVHPEILQHHIVELLICSHDGENLTLDRRGLVLENDHHNVAGYRNALDHRRVENVDSSVNVVSHVLLRLLHKTIDHTLAIRSKIHRWFSKQETYTLISNNHSILRGIRHSGYLSMKGRRLRTYDDRSLLSMTTVEFHQFLEGIGARHITRKTHNNKEMNTYWKRRTNPLPRDTSLPGQWVPLSMIVSNIQTITSSHGDVLDRDDDFDAKLPFQIYTPSIPSP